MLDYNTLNDKQLEAVQTTEGPLLVIAGAGSGKTRVLTYRIAHLITEKNVKPYNILAITFTNKAAKEMKERVDGLVGDVSNDIWISTFHSACVRMLRRDIEKLGYDKNFVIFDSADQKTLIKECMKEKKLGTLEIRQYEKQATRYDHDHLITVSQEYLDMLNNMDKQECKVTYLW